MRKIKLYGKRGEGLFVLVDDKDFDKLNKYRWYLKTDKRWIHNQYAIRFEKINGKNKSVRMHRQILKAPKHLLVDHIDCNGLNNQRFNLRLCTFAENSQHSRVLSKYSTTSDYKGVYLHKDKKVWMARISYNNNIIYLGIYHTQEEAAKVYDAAARILHGKFAIVNFKKEYKKTHKAALQFINRNFVKASPYKGVSHNGNNWRATFYFKKQQYRLGTYKTEKEAALAYNKKAKELLGDLAKLNKIT